MLLHDRCLPKALFRFTFSFLCCWGLRERVEITNYGRKSIEFKPWLLCFVPVVKSCTRDRGGQQRTRVVGKTCEENAATTHDNCGHGGCVMPKVQKKYKTKKQLSRNRKKKRQGNKQRKRKKRRRGSINPSLFTLNAHNKQLVGIAWGGHRTFF